MCGEGRKVSLLRKILPEVLDKKVALRSAELRDSYDKTRAFVMKYAVQERMHSNTDMDTSEPSGCYNGGGYYNGIEEVDYSEAYYDEQNPWGYPAVGYDGFELNTVAFGKAKGKGKAKGYQNKGYQPSGAKGQKVFEKGKEETVVEKVKLKVDKVISAVY